MQGIDMSIPHKCPVCEGRGIVPDYFYVISPDIQHNGFTWNSTGSVTCKSCFGTGIIWEWDAVIVPSIQIGEPGVFTGYEITSAST